LRRRATTISGTSGHLQTFLGRAPDTAAPEDLRLFPAASDADRRGCVGHQWLGLRRCVSFFTVTLGPPRDGTEPAPQGAGAEINPSRNPKPGSRCQEQADKPLPPVKRQATRRGSTAACCTTAGYHRLPRGPRQRRRLPENQKADSPLPKSGEPSLPSENTKPPVCWPTAVARKLNRRHHQRSHPPHCIAATTC